MNRVLIIDDEIEKGNDIAKHFDDRFVKIDLVRTTIQAYQLLRVNQYNLVVLDISLKQEGFPGSSLIGTEVLDKMQWYHNSSPVVVVTQFFNYELYQGGKYGFYLINKNFGKLPEYRFDPEKDINLLPNLHEYLSESYQNYLGCILYQSNDSIWVENLKKIVLKIEVFQNESIIIG